MKQDVLFIGNGINNINNTKSWAALVSALRKEVGKSEDAKDVIKQFPLLFENIFNYGIRNGRIGSEISLKKIVAEHVNQIERNDIHKRIDEINSAHIITTNYDLTLERDLNWKVSSIYEEQKYSIFRRATCIENGRNIWYIHGDCRTKNSINLGYEHYGGQLQQIRNFIITGKRFSKDFRIQRLGERLGNLSKNPDSWIDLFFNSDIHIVGLCLDFIEIELWWLLAYRAKLLAKPNKKIQNDIYYYIPIEYLDESKGKLELLYNFGIKIRPLDGEDEAYYNNVLDVIEGKVRYDSKKASVLRLMNRWLEEIIN